MAVTRFTKMAYANADDMIFGKAVKPLKQGWGLRSVPATQLPK